MAKVQKQMLCISTYIKDCEYYLRVEIEPYFKRKNRPPFMLESLPFTNKSILLRDTKFKEELAFTAVLCVLVRDGAPDHKGRYREAVIYPHNNGPHDLHVRFDRDRYLTRPKRELCCLIPVKNFICSEQLDNKTLSLNIAEKILTYLPINEELCMTEDTELLRYYE